MESYFPYSISISISFLNAPGSPGDDVILNFLRQGGKVRAEPMHANDQVAEIFRMLLSLAQGFGADHIDLDMMSASVE